MTWACIVYVVGVVVSFFVRLYEEEIADFIEKLKLILDCVEWE